MAWYLKEGFGLDSNSLNQKKLSFEASIHYYHHRNALENLNSLLPCSRIIWILRNPLPRAVSEYLHQAVKAKKYPSFQKLILQELYALKHCSSLNDSFENGFESKLFSCLARYKLQKYLISTAFYVYFIYAWLEKFPIEQHFFLDYEFFRRNPEKALQKIHNFLNISSEPITEAVWKFNKANTRNEKAAALRRKISITKNMEENLLTHISYPVEGLFRLIGQDFNWPLTSLT